MSTTTQTILITGATSGIGRETALYLARRGHRVIASGRNREQLASLKEEAAGAALETVRLDVCDAQSIAEAAKEVERTTGGRGIDALVNNAGFGFAVAADEMTDADLRAQFETNVFGLMAMVRAFVPQMRARGRGRIVNVSSVGGRVTLPFFGAYNATKYAVESLSDAMRIELKPFGVDVAIIEPGAIRTRFAVRTVEEANAYHVANSPYAPAYANYRKMAKRADDMAPGPLVVARAIERAVTARRPKARYLAPRLTGWLILAMARLLPTRVLDGVFRLALGITRKRLLPASAASHELAPAQQEQ